MDKKEAIEILRKHYANAPFSERIALETLIPELKESEDDKIRKYLIDYVKSAGVGNSLFDSINTKENILLWLEKQGEQKKINLVEILKHYPRETELFSPIYGKLWLAEVDEKHEIITCYRHRLDEGCTRAILEQEDTVSFYSNGTTGLPDFSISKDCMLFLYDNENLDKQKEILCDKCRKTQPSHSCQDITALGRCALENQDKQKLSEAKNEIKNKCPNYSEGYGCSTSPLNRCSTCSYYVLYNHWNPNDDKEQLDRAIYMMEQLDITKSWGDVYNWLKSLRHKK